MTTRGRRELGAYIVYDRTFQDRVREELRKRTWTQKDLADKIVADPSSVSELLSRKKKGLMTSRLVERVCAVLNLQLPAPHMRDADDLATKILQLREEDPSGYAIVTALLDKFEKKKD